MPAQRRERVTERDEVARNQPRALVNQLVERVLPVGARLAPVNRARVVAHPLPSIVTCFPLLSMVNCWRYAGKRFR